MKCAWCDREDELVAVEVEPPVIAGRDQWAHVTKGAVMAMACPDHKLVVYDPTPNVQKVRRRKARGYQQQTIFDALPEETAQSRRDRSPLFHGTNG